MSDFKKSILVKKNQIQTQNYCPQTKISLKLTLSSVYQNIRRI